MGNHKDMENLSIRISPQVAGYNPRTIARGNLYNWDPGSQPETVTMGDPAINGEVPTRTIKNFSREGTITISAGSTDDAYLDDLCANAIECTIVIIDESSTNYKKETTGSRVFFQEPADPYDGDTRDFVVKMAKYGKKSS